ncbi:hypothetical protein DFJ73DRAFT_957453 [Zopfochytrium polystomum]|nr:hypothetical protein DFJ73DRAFT_957453 [Zopfochytrium polystomum]
MPPKPNTAATATSAAAVPRRRRSLLSRPLDLFFVVFFLLHIPTTLLIGTQSLVPASAVPAPLRDAVKSWAATSGDPWLARIAAEQPLPAWWIATVAVELAFQLPWFFWFIYVAVVDSPALPTGSIIYAVQCMTSMVPILSEIVFAHPELTATQRRTVFGAYFPYFIVPALLLMRATVWEKRAGAVTAAGKGKRE